MFSFPLALRPNDNVRVMRRLRANGSARARYLDGLEALETRVLLAGTPTQLIFTNPTSNPVPITPPQIAAQAPFFPAIQVNVTDNTGSLVVTDHSLVLLTIAAGPQGGILSGNLVVTAVNGIATFSNVMFSIAGNYTLQASSGNLTTTVSTFINVTPPAAKLAFESQPANLTADGSINLAVDVQDLTGALVTTDRSSVTIAIATGNGTLVGTTTVQAVNGVATFNGLSLPKTGDYTLKVTDGNLIAATTASFTVSPGAASQLVFTQQPTQTPQGNIIAPTISIQVQDAFGNLITADTSNVTLTIGPGSPQQSILSGTTTVPVVAGIASFTDLSLNQVGNYTLVATDAALPNPTKTSNSFAVTGPPSKLAFQTTPAQTTVGQIIAPSVLVLVQDVAGNTLTEDNSDVTITVFSGPGALAGTVTVPAVNGVATFSDLSLSVDGTYRLQANDGLLNPAISSGFVVNGLPAKLAFKQTPPQTAANSVLSPPVIVLVQDSNGNTVAGDTSSVTVVLGPGTGTGSLNGTTTVSAINGVATFNNLKISVGGDYSLTASDGALTGATSGTFTITRPASQLFFQTGPINTAGNSTMANVVVNIKDSIGHLVTTDKSNVTLMIISGPAGGVIAGNATVAAVNGVATFNNLKFATTGTYTLVAFDGSLGTATSNSFVITDPATKLVITQQLTRFTASNDTTGSATPILTVQVQDRKGNLVGSDHSQVTIAIASGPAGATITGNASVTVVNGFATFDHIGLTKAGNYTFTVSGPSLTSGTTNSKSIVDPDSSSARLVATQKPGPAVVGTNFNPKLVVSVQDKFGNLVTTASTKVTIAIGTSPAGATLKGTATVSTSGGVATFNTLSLDKVGAYTLNLTSSDAGIQTGTSNASTGSLAQTVTLGISWVTSPPGNRTINNGAALNFTTNFKSSAPTGAPFTFSGNVTLIESVGTVNTTLATVPISTSGAAKFTLNGTSALVTGTHLLTVVYEGDTFHTGAASPSFTVKVNP